MDGALTRGTLWNRL